MADPRRELTPEEFAQGALELKAGREVLKMAMELAKATREDGSIGYTKLEMETNAGKFIILVLNDQVLCNVMEYSAKLAGQAVTEMDQAASKADQN